MNLLTWLALLALGMGLIGLGAFLWSMRSGQLDDLDGAAERVLLHEAADTPLTNPSAARIENTGFKGEVHGQDRG